MRRDQNLHFLTFVGIQTGKKAAQLSFLKTSRKMRCKILTATFFSPLKNSANVKGYACKTGNFLTLEFPKEKLKSYIPSTLKCLAFLLGSQIIPSLHLSAPQSSCI